MWLTNIFKGIVLRLQYKRNLNNKQLISRELNHKTVIEVLARGTL